ncbi:MAG: cytoplasmic protein [Comamonas sp.]|nr:cytoplasmic protein [Comamonas sp.]
MDVIEAHRHSSRHRSEIEASDLCGCFYCLETYSPSAITEWIDEGDGTALCPKCGIDAVLGSASSAQINTRFLRSMHKKWF